jgi:hypothetical protein
MSETFVNKIAERVSHSAFHQSEFRGAFRCPEHPEHAVVEYGGVYWCGGGQSHVLYEPPLPPRPCPICGKVGSPPGHLNSKPSIMNLVSCV